MASPFVLEDDFIFSSSEGRFLERDREQSNAPKIIARIEVEIENVFLEKVDICNLSTSGGRAQRVDIIKFVYQNGENLTSTQQQSR